MMPPPAACPKSATSIDAEDDAVPVRAAVPCVRPTRRGAEPAYRQHTAVDGECGVMLDIEVSTRGGQDLSWPSAT
jgi:hypothetical protein